MTIYTVQHVATVRSKTFRWWSWACYDCEHTSPVRYASSASAMGAGRRLHDCSVPATEGGD